MCEYLVTSQLLIPSSSYSPPPPHFPPSCATVAFLILITDMMNAVVAKAMVKKMNKENRENRKWICN